MLCLSRLFVSFQLCVCVCVCVCMNAIWSMWNGENKDCWHQLLHSVAVHNKAMLLFANR